MRTCLSKLERVAGISASRQSLVTAGFRSVHAQGPADFIISNVNISGEVFVRVIMNCRLYDGDYIEGASCLVSFDLFRFWKLLKS